MITFHNKAPRYSGAIDRAVKAWNSAKVGIRFRRTSIEHARVVFRYAKTRGRPNPWHCEGMAGMGYPGVLLQTNIFVVRDCASSELRTFTAAHELGHVLGLGHEDGRCSVMNWIADRATSLGYRCGRPSAKRRRELVKRLVLADDRRGAVARYRDPFVRNDTYAGFDPAGGTRKFERAPMQFRALSLNPVLKYRWSFGDPESGAANSATGTTVSHAFSDEGIFPVTLEIVDGGVVAARQTRVLSLLACLFCRPSENEKAR